MECLVDSAVIYMEPFSLTTQQSLLTLVEAIRVLMRTLFNGVSFSSYVGCCQRCEQTAIIDTTKELCEECLREYNKEQERIQQWVERGDNIYFILAKQLNVVKIGYSSTPIQRFTQIRSSAPDTLTLEAVAQGSKESTF